EQRGLSHPGSTHQHDDQEGPIDVESLRLPTQIRVQTFQRSMSDRRNWIAARRIQPSAQSTFQFAQGRRQGAKEGLRGGGSLVHYHKVSRMLPNLFDPDKNHWFPG